jgi:hypothetical protein
MSLNFPFYIFEDKKYKSIFPQSFYFLPKVLKGNFDVIVEESVKTLPLAIEVFDAIYF